MNGMEKRMKVGGNGEEKAQVKVSMMLQKSY